MSATQEKGIKKNDLTIFDDTMLPVSRISADRSDRIEELVTPLLNEEIEKLRKEKPHLFPNFKK